MRKIIVMIAAVLTFALVAAATEAPRAEAFLGYNFVRFNPDSGYIPSFNANGGSGQFVYNFNKWLGAAVDLGAVTKGTLNHYNVDSTVVDFVAGPRVTFHSHGRFMPFAQVLFGGAYATASLRVAGAVLPPGIVLPPGLPITARLNVSRTGFAMLAGGGLDIRMGRHAAFRPIGVDYYLTRMPSFLTGNDHNANNFRYSGGFAFWFGGEKAAPQANRQVQHKTCPDGSTVPANAACPKLNFSMTLTATPSELCPGETARLVPSLSGASPNQLSFSSWSVNGQQVSQVGSYEFQSEGRAPGIYRVKLSAGGDAYNSASAETTITVREYQPPTGTVQANPAQIRAGDKSTVSANFQGQCGGPIQSPTYEASEGTIQGDQFDSSSMQWDTSNNGEQRKTVTITAKAADNRSVGSATTTIEVVRSAVVMPVRLPDVLFPAGNSRVNNCGKRILLEQLRAYYERDSSGTVVLVGHTSSDETNDKLAQERVDNAAAIITAGTGICLSIPKTQVQVSAPGADQNGVPYESGFCRSSVGPIGPNTEMRRVEVWFVPSGGQIPSSVTNSQSVSSLSIGNLGCPK